MQWKRWCSSNAWGCPTPRPSRCRLATSCGGTCGPCASCGAGGRSRCHHCPLPARAGATGELLSSSTQAARLWGAFGVAALLFAGATLALAQAPARQGEGRHQRYLASDTCEDEARPLVLEPSAAVPQGLVGIQAPRLPRSRFATHRARASPSTVASCAPSPESPLDLAVAHAGLTLAAGLAGDAQHGPDPRGARRPEKIALEVSEARPGGATGAVAALVRSLEQGSAPAAGGRFVRSHIEIGLCSIPSAGSFSTRSPGSSAELQARAPPPIFPLGLALALDGLRAARASGSTPRAR